MRKKILLLEPLITEAELIWGSFNRHRGYLPPMGLISIYNYMKQHKFNITFIDINLGGWDRRSLKRHLIEHQYDVIGIPVFTTTAEASFVTASLVKDALPESMVVFGGVHVTTLPKQTLEECTKCDLIILGEGEVPFRRFIEKLEANETYKNLTNIAYRDAFGKPVVNERGTEYFTMDELPTGFYADIDLSPYIPHVTQYRRLPNYPLVIQRGCPFKCIFCDASTIHGKRLRSYSVDRVIEELKILKYKHNARGIYFQDSSFTVNKIFVLQLCEKMLRERLNLLWSCTTRADMVDEELLKAMKRAGCWQILYGLESANQKSLDILKKGTTEEDNRRAVRMTQKVNIQVSTSYILGIPGEDEKMVQKTINFANEMAAESAYFYLPVPYPGTELHRICLTEGTIRKDVKWSDYRAIDFDNPIYVNPNLGAEKMKYYYKKAFSNYYRNPKVYLANLRTINSYDDIRRYYRIAKLFIGMKFFSQ